MKVYQEKDYKTISHWCALRDMEPPPEWSLPELGVMVENIAVGFLILTNNNCAFLDFYISNPMSDKTMRSRALDQITEALIDTAKDLRVKLVMCNTASFPVKERARRHDFESVGEMTHFRKVL